MMKLNFNFRPNLNYIIWFILGFILSLFVNSASATTIDTIDGYVINEEYIYNEFSKNEDFDINIYKNIICNKETFTCIALDDASLKGITINTYNSMSDSIFRIKIVPNHYINYFYLYYSPHPYMTTGKNASVTSPIVGFSNIPSGKYTSQVSFGVFCTSSTQCGSSYSDYYINISEENLPLSGDKLNSLSKGRFPNLDFSTYLDKTLISINIYDTDKKLINAKICKKSDFDNGQFCGLTFDNFKAKYMTIAYHLNNYPNTYSVTSSQYYSLYYSLVNSLGSNFILSYKFGYYDENNEYQSYTIKNYSSITSYNEELGVVRVLFGSGLNISKIDNFTINLKLNSNANSIYFTGDFDLINEVDFDPSSTGSNIMNDNLNDIKDTLNNSNINGANDKANDLFNNFDDNDYGLSDIVRMPLTLINSLTTVQELPFSATLPFVNKTVTFPNMRNVYSEFFGDFFTLYQQITFGFISYYVILNIYRLVKGFKDPENDKIEVVDL